MRRDRSTWKWVTKNTVFSIRNIATMHLTGTAEHEQFCTFSAISTRIDLSQHKVSLQGYHL